MSRTPPPDSRHPEWSNPNYLIENGGLPKDFTLDGYRAFAVRLDGGVMLHVYLMNGYRTAFDTSLGPDRFRLFIRDLVADQILPQFHGVNCPSQRCFEILREHADKPCL